MKKRSLVNASVVGLVGGAATSVFCALMARSLGEISNVGDSFWLVSPVMGAAVAAGVTAFRLDPAIGRPLALALLAFFCAAFLETLLAYGALLQPFAISGAPAAQAEDMDVLGQALNMLVLIACFLTIPMGAALGLMFGKAPNRQP